jgi:hypothetical protein
MPSRSVIEKSLVPMRPRTAAISSRISCAESGCFASSQKNHVNEFAEVSCPARRRVLGGVKKKTEWIAWCPNTPNLIDDLTICESGVGIFRPVSAQKNAHDIAAVPFDDASAHYPARDLSNTTQVVSEATILASRKIDKKIEDRFREVPPEIFKQRLERTMVKGVNTVSRLSSPDSEGLMHSQKALVHVGHRIICIIQGPEVEIEPSLPRR